jgi:hypothetical protein
MDGICGSRRYRIRAGALKALASRKDQVRVSVLAPTLTFHTWFAPLYSVMPPTCALTLAVVTFTSIPQGPRREGRPTSQLISDFFYPLRLASQANVGAQFVSATFAPLARAPGTVLRLSGYQPPSSAPSYWPAAAVSATTTSASRKPRRQPLYDLHNHLPVSTGHPRE